MKSLLPLATLAPAFLAAALASAQAQVPVKVHVTSITEVPKIDRSNRKAMQKELEAKARAAYEARKAAEKELKAQFGKKKEAWPAEKQEAYRALEDDEAEADAALAYLEVDPKGLADSAQDIRESLAGKGIVGVKEYAQHVDDPQQADLIVEVVGRRSARTNPEMLFDNRHWVAFKIKAAPNFDASRLGKVPPKYAGGGLIRHSTKLHTWSAEEPYITLEVYQEGGRWSAIGNVVADTLNTFMKDNYVTLKAK